jgi:preprotein translocase subunit SecG
MPQLRLGKLGPLTPLGRLTLGPIGIGAVVLVLGTEGAAKRVGYMLMTAFFVVALGLSVLSRTRFRRFANRFVKPS